MLGRFIEEIPNFLSYYNMIFLLKATATTFWLSVVGCAIGTIIGFFLAIIRITRGRLLSPIRILTISFVEFFRRVPFLVVLLLVFFIFQALNISHFIIALISVFVVAASYTTEIVRAGIESVPITQWETADSLNFSLAQKLRMVIFPQAWKIILPPVFGFFILFIKQTALASQIGVIELTFAGKVLNNKGFSALLVYGTILVLYFFLSYLISRIGEWMEKKIGIS